MTTHQTLPLWILERDQAAQDAGIRVDSYYSQDPHGALPVWYNSCWEGAEEQFEEFERRHGMRSRSCFYDEVPIRAVCDDGVEVMEYIGKERHIAYYGNPEILLERGFIPSLKRVPKGFSPARRYYGQKSGLDDAQDSQFWWECHRQIDGNVLYEVTDTTERRKRHCMPTVRPTEKVEFVPGVTMVEHPHARYYYGKIEDLGKAGLIRDGCLPGDPGQCKTVGRYKLNGREVPARSSGRFHGRRGAAPCRTRTS